MAGRSIGQNGGANPFLQCFDGVVLAGRQHFRKVSAATRWHRVAMISLIAFEPTNVFVLAAILAMET